MGAYETGVDPRHASLLRRLKRAGDIRLVFDRMITAASRLGLRSEAAIRVVFRMPERLALLASDLAECGRIGGGVPHPGNPHLAILGTPGRVSQPRRYRGYWFDPSARSLVGLCLGIDLVRHDQKLHLVEFNLNASLRPERRALYESSLDPVVSGLVSTARDHGFKRMVPYARSWTGEYVEEFERAGREFGVEVYPAGLIAGGGPGVRFLAALPDPLEPETVYVVFLGRKAPVEQYIHNKDISGFWFPEALARTRRPDGVVRAIPTYNRLTVPPMSEDNRWPNVVIKLAESDEGRHVLAARLRDEQHGRKVLGLGETDGIPRAFRLAPPSRLVRRITGGRVIYQPFIPPEVDRGGHTRKFRLHLFVSPLWDRYLSAHAIESEGRVPDGLPEGAVSKDGSYIISYSTGSAGYLRIEPGLEMDVERASEEIGAAIRDGLSRKFEIGPEGGLASGE